MSFIFTLSLFLISALCVYDVPSYYGHFSREYFLVDKIRAGTFRYFQYHYALDVDSSNKTVYFANSKQHYPEKNCPCWYMWDIWESGGWLVSYATQQPNIQSIQSQTTMEMLIVANKTCLSNESDCILSDETASSMTLTMDNLRPEPPITQFPDINPSQTTFLYVSDTDNHCIKKIDLTLKTSVVVAGQCGTNGFKDGPDGLNLLNKPTNLGITQGGQLYFYDLGNEYMRKLETTGFVTTLKNGACKKFGTSRTVGGYTLNNILCYDNWIEGQTKAPVQHVIDPSQINICIQHVSKC